MKRKKILALEAKQPTHDGNVFTVQALDEIIIFNFFNNKKLHARYCMNMESQEYETFFAGENTWVQRRIADLWGQNIYNAWHDVKAEPDSKEDLAFAKEQLQAEHASNIFSAIENKEWSRNKDIREKSRENKEIRIANLMNRVGRLPSDFEGWICKAAGVENYAFLDKASGGLICSACREVFPRKKENGKKAAHNEQTECPHCKEMLTVKTRTDHVSVKTHAMLLQCVDDVQNVARHFTVKIVTDAAGVHADPVEDIRIMLYKQPAKQVCKLYYSMELWNRYSWVPEWSEKNGCNRRIFSEYLYPGGIAESLAQTAYEAWIPAFTALAAAGRQLLYNNLMSGTGIETLPDVVEYLFKGRFYRLVEETAKTMGVFWGSRYLGPLNIHACREMHGQQTVEEIFRIRDKQKINRIREHDGGEKIVSWMQFSESAGQKITDEALKWLMENDMDPKSILFIKDRMSVQQVMNYVKKQQASEYAGWETKVILSQWEDYLSMCEKAGRDLTDEMIYRPRQLKRRHDELVEEMNKIRILEDMQRNEEERKKAAEELREKFPGAEEALAEVRAKFTYANEQFCIIVPETLFEIVTEGQALHHCVGTSDRYFDRIMQHETYICFLRRVSEPDTPFYTIEVEPGGTVRQHRSYLDEEPGIEEIRGFLREWQQAVKKRMNEQDRKHAEISRKKREENIEELKRNNNIRVLQGLKEDFMEAI